MTEMYLPSSENMGRDAIVSQEKARQEDFSKDIVRYVAVGSGVCCDGLKVEVSDKKKYNIVIHYIATTRHSAVTGGWRAWRL